MAGRTRHCESQTANLAEANVWKQWFVMKRVTGTFTSVSTHQPCRFASVADLELAPSLTWDYSRRCRFHDPQTTISRVGIVACSSTMAIGAINAHFSSSMMLPLPMTL